MDSTSNAARIASSDDGPLSINVRKKVRHSDLDRVEVALLLALLDYVDVRKHWDRQKRIAVCFPGKGSLAFDTRYSERQLLTAQIGLERRGLIAVQHRSCAKPKPGEAKGKTNVYTIRVHAIDELRDVKPAKAPAIISDAPLATEEHPQSLPMAPAIVAGGTGNDFRWHPQSLPMAPETIADKQLREQQSELARKSGKVEPGAMASNADETNDLEAEDHPLTNAERSEAVDPVEDQVSPVRQQSFPVPPAPPIPEPPPAAPIPPEPPKWCVVEDCGQIAGKSDQFCAAHRAEQQRAAAHRMRASLFNGDDAEEPTPPAPRKPEPCIKQCGNLAEPGSALCVECAKPKDCCEPGCTLPTFAGLDRCIDHQVAFDIAQKRHGSAA